MGVQLRDLLVLECRCRLDIYVRHCLLVEVSSLFMVWVGEWVDVYLLHASVS